MKTKEILQRWLFGSVQAPCKLYALREFLDMREGWKPGNGNLPAGVLQTPIREIGIPRRQAN
jgi:hypothetical protein